MRWSFLQEQLHGSAFTRVLVSPSAPKARTCGPTWMGAVEALMASRRRRRGHDSVAGPTSGNR